MHENNNKYKIMNYNKYPNLFDKKIEDILRYAAQKESDNWLEEDEHKASIYDNTYGKALIELRELKRENKNHG